jgi:hypothetical protein
LQDYPSGLTVSHHFFHTLLAWLVSNSPVSVADWQGRAGLDMLNSAPFNACVRLEGDSITQDRDRLERLTANDVYT